MILIGDVHGCYKTLEALLEKCPDEPICFVGDLIDRGPDSAKVVSFVKRRGHFCVMGNHERMAINALEDKNHGMDLWLMNGGRETLLSYARAGTDPGKIDPDHLEWMKRLPLCKKFDEETTDGRKLFVSHAGVYEGIFDTFEEATSASMRNEDILWHRDRLQDDPGIFQVIGHTPQKNGVTVGPHYAKIDTGVYLRRRAFEGGYNPYGTLTALRFPQMEFIVQENVEDY